MANDWPYRKIEEIAEKVGMGPFGSSIKVETFVSEGIPIVSGQHLHGFRLDEEPGFNFISEEHANRLKNANLYRGDVVFTHAGNIENVAYIPENSKYERYVASQRQFYMRCDLNQVLPSWVVYYFKTPEGKHKLTANSSSVGVPSIAQPVSYLRQLEIPVPPLPEQRAIAGVLGALDDKIELNRRMNRTLEAMARAVFRHWFVENEEVASWKVVPLPEIIEVNPPRSLRKGEVAPYLDMANMPTQGHRGIEWVDRPFGSGTKFINGDTLLARITPCLENGKTAFVDFLKDGQVGWGSTEYIVFRPKPPLPPEYGYYLARSEELRNHAIVNMTGTSGRQRTPASCFDSFLVPVPPAELAIKFGVFAKAVIDKVRANDEQSRTLAALRDALLPKLMRGEVRVRGWDNS